MVDEGCGAAGNAEGAWGEGRARTWGLLAHLSGVVPRPTTSLADWTGLAHWCEHALREWLARLGTLAWRSPAITLAALSCVSLYVPSLRASGAEVADSKWRFPRKGMGAGPV